MKHFNSKINAIFKPFRNIQIAMLFIFEINVLVRYILLMGIQKTIDSVNSKELQVTQKYLIFCVFLISIFFIINALFQYWYRYLEYTSQYSLMKQLFGMTMRKPFSFHEKYSSAASLTMIKDDSKFIADWKGMGMLTLVLNIFSLLIAFSIMFYYSITITLIVFFIILACYLCTHYISKAITKQTYKLQEANTEISNRIVECFDGIKDIKQYKKEAFFEKKLAQYIDIHSFKYSKNISRLYAAFTSTYAMLAIAVPVLVVLIGVILVLKNQLTIGSLIALYGIAGTLQEPVQVIPDFLNKRAQALAMQEKIEPILKDDSIKYSTDKLKKLETLSFNSLHYTFKDGKSILNNLNFSLHNGDVAIVKGSSGKGKTSLINIISRFYETENQPMTIKYNGISINEINPDMYYTHIIQAQQTPYIFSGTVLNNLTLGDSFSKEELNEAINATFLNDFIDSKGLDYMINPNGNNISGGEKQRICLARALLRKPDLLMLDKPVSALNPEMVNMVTKGVAQFCSQKNITLILISHNDSFEHYYNQKKHIIQI